MKRDDFRHMYRGKQLHALTEKDVEAMRPYKKTGQGKEHALLMLHGFTSSPAVYRNLLPLIKGYDAIVCPVLSGHADSIDAFAQSTAMDWMESAEKACEALLNDYKKVDVLGLSLGGLLACALSQKFSLHHLYLLAPALDIRLKINNSLTLARLCHALGFRQYRNVAGNILNPDQSEISYRRLPTSIIIEILTLIDEFNFVAPPCPIDLFLGRKDAVVNSEKVNKRFKKLNHASIHWLNHSAHVLPLDNDVQYIADCINKNMGS